jgi:Na+/H+ antiporter NhaD/arsenite permease-like protein
VPAAGLNPVPFLVGLACAANIGSAATLIGNPQNMLIGSVLKLHFADYVRQALPPVAISLLLLVAVAGLRARCAGGQHHRARCGAAADDDPKTPAFDACRPPRA